VKLLRVHVTYLRRKLGDQPRRPRLILTEPSVGYRLWVEPAGTGRTSDN
jgi:two-component system KDP operon response regulator KdpE